MRMANTVQVPPQNPAVKLGVLGALYFTQGLPYGLFTQALPVMMRQQGFSLESIGFSSLLALPWALKLLWAPWVDATVPGTLGRRKRWILPLQVAMVLLLVALSVLSPRGGIVVLLAGVLLTNLVSATQDIATDGLAVDALRPEERGWGNGMQVAGYRLGMIVGGGVLLVVHDELGTSATFAAMALLVAVASGPVVAFHEPVVATPVVRARLRDARFWQRADAWRLLLLILVYKGAGAFATGMVRPLLVDAGLSLSDIGWLLGTFGFLAALAGAITGGALVGPLGRKRSLWVFGLASAAAASSYALFAVLPAGPVLLATVVTVESFVGGMRTAAVFTCMMDWSSAETSATDYTIQACAVVVALTAGSALSGVSAAVLGYGGHFLLGAALCVAAVVLALRLFPHHQA
jgi:MFS family permease